MPVREPKSWWGDTADAHWGHTAGAAVGSAGAGAGRARRARPHACQQGVGLEPIRQSRQGQEQGKGAGERKRVQESGRSPLYRSSRGKGQEQKGQEQQGLSQQGQGQEQGKQDHALAAASGWQRYHTAAAAGAVAARA